MYKQNMHTMKDVRSKWGNDEAPLGFRLYKPSMHWRAQRYALAFVWNYTEVYVIPCFIHVYNFIYDWQWRKSAGKGSNILLWFIFTSSAVQNKDAKSKWRNDNCLGQPSSEKSIWMRTTRVFFLSASWLITPTDIL